MHENGIFLVPVKYTLVCHVPVLGCSLYFFLYICIYVTCMYMKNGVAISLVHKEIPLQHSLEISDAISKVAERLQECSKAKRYNVSKEDWPPFQPKHFTGVALIHFEKGHTVRRDIEVIAETQHKGLTEPLAIEDVNIVPTAKNLSQIFTNVETTGNCPTIILIEGAPGIGKTTLCKEILFQWSNKNLLTAKKLVILVFLRDPGAQGIKSLHDFVKSYCNYTEESNAIIEKYIRSTQGEDIAVVLDGYDELPEHIRNNTDSFFIQLINQNCDDMVKCTVVITSRLNVSGELREVVKRRVEILGFTDESRRAYIWEALGNESKNESSIYHRKVYCSKDEDAKKLIQFLDMNPAINAYCYIPLNMTILLCVFIEDKNAKLPTTQTEINQKFICITISRFIRKKDPDCSIADFTNIPRCYKRVFMELCHLAFIALKTGKIVFTKDEIQRDCKQLSYSGNWSGLDLLKAVEFVSVKENVQSSFFNFLHLSFQETLAAYRITNLYSYQQVRLLKENFLNSKYFNVWIMYVGLTSGKSVAFKHFLSGNLLLISTFFQLWLSSNPEISQEHVDNKITSLHLFQCFSEAENDDMCQYVGQLLQNGKIDLNGQTLSAVNILTLALFLDRSSTKHWKMLNLGKCSLGDTEIEKFNSSCSNTKKIVSIDKLDLSYNSFTKASAATLANLLLAWHVKTITMYSCDTGVDRTIVRNIVDQLFKTEPHTVQCKISTNAQPNPIVYQLQIDSFKKHSSIHLFSCHLGSDYNKITETMLVLAETKANVYFYSCESSNLSFLDLIDVVSKTKLSSFHCMKHSNVTLSELNIVSKQLSGFAITFGEDVLPLHCYRTQNNISNFKEDLKQEIGNGTFVFWNCSLEEIRDIIVYFTTIPPNTNDVENESTELFIMKYHLRYVNVAHCQWQTKILLWNIPLVRNNRYLRYFNCSGCKLDDDQVEYLACAINRNDRLEQLILGNCALKPAGLVKIFIELKQLSTIKYLDLSNNCMSEEIVEMLVDVIFCNQINHLNLSNCFHGVNSDKVIVAISNSVTLRYLDFSHNLMDEVIVLEDAIITNSNLQHLELASCKLYQQVLYCSNQNKSVLLSLNLSYQPISDHNAEILAQMITGTQCIEKLCMKRCSLTHNGLQTIIQALSHIKCLKVLDLSHNNMSQADLDVSSIALANLSLENLNLSYCKLREDVMTAVLYELNSENLKVLNVSGNRITDSVAYHIAAVISDAVHLRALHLSDCRITEGSFIAIMNAINCLLAQLDISYNSVNNVTARLVADVIARNIGLTYLDFSCCKMEEEGLTSMLKQVRNVAQMKYIDVQSSSINNVIAKELANIIKSTNTLCYLGLSNCSLGEKRFLLIIDAIKDKKLRGLDISSNSITDEVAQMLLNTDLFSVNSELEFLNISNCQWQKDGLSKIFTTAIDICNLKYMDSTGCIFCDDEIAQFLSHSITAHKTWEQLLAMKPHGLDEDIASLKEKISTLNHFDFCYDIFHRKVICALYQVLSAKHITFIRGSLCTWNKRFSHTY